MVNLLFLIENNLEDFLAILIRNSLMLRDSRFYIFPLIIYRYLLFLGIYNCRLRSARISNLY